MDAGDNELEKARNNQRTRRRTSTDITFGQTIPASKETYDFKLILLAYNTARSKLFLSILPLIMASCYFMCEADEILEEEVQPGSIYEIYHKNLPPRTHLQLRSVRVFMVINHFVNH